MTDRPNKPGSDATTPVEEEPAVENQTSVTPDDYPKSVGGKPDYKDRDKA